MAALSDQFETSKAVNNSTSSQNASSLSKSELPGWYNQSGSLSSNFFNRYFGTPDQYQTTRTRDYSQPEYFGEYLDPNKGVNGTSTVWVPEGIDSNGKVFGKTVVTGGQGGNGAAGSQGRQANPLAYIESQTLIPGTEGILPTQGYQGQRVAGLSALQQAGLGQGSNYLNQGQDLYGQGVGSLGQAGSYLSQSGQYNPNQMQQHLNPYLDGALGTMASLANRNLSENVMPGVNSTFTGMGQFGSSRNADFLNRAIRDNQEGIQQTGATMINQAYDQASQDYLNWDKQTQGAAGQFGILGQLQGQYGINGLNTGMELGALDYLQQQKLVDANKAQWTENYTFPLDIYNQLAQAYNTSVGQLAPSSTSTSSSSGTSGSTGTTSSFGSKSGLTI